MPQTTREQHNCYKNIANAKRKGRTWYVCSECGKDVSIAWFYFQLVINRKKK